MDRYIERRIAAGDRRQYRYPPQEEIHIPEGRVMEMESYMIVALRNAARDKPDG
jgi:hypothetical protein